MQTNPHAASPTAFVIGEALIDIVETAGSSEEYVGGGPANIAIGLARLGVPAGLFAWIGDDERGRRISGMLADEGVALHPEAFSAERTSTARAVLAADGSATYDFDIDWRVPRLSIDAPQVLHAGSIALFLQPGADEVLETLRRYRGRSLITVDPNIRPSLLPDHAVALAQFERAAALATLVKLSDEDAEWLYPELTQAEVLAHVCSLGPESCILTRGADGVRALHRGEAFEADSYLVPVADTISAGDSFMANVIATLLEARAELDQARFAELLDSAARAAAIAVSRPGAAPPTAAELAAFPSRLG